MVFQWLGNDHCIGMEGGQLVGSGGGVSGVAAVDHADEVEPAAVQMGSGLSLTIVRDFGFTIVRRTQGLEKLEELAGVSGWPRGNPIAAMGTGAFFGTARGSKCLGDAGGVSVDAEAVLADEERDHVRSNCRLRGGLTRAGSPCHDTGGTPVIGAT
jgi:hypothetical protein